MNDREKLVAVLNEIEDDVGFICDSCGEAKKSICIESFADHLIANGVTVHQWINVNDQLPQPGERVIATDGEFAGEMYINSRGKWQRYNVNDHALMMVLDILWWMPLPEPPKEDNHEAY